MADTAAVEPAGAGSVVADAIRRIGRLVPMALLAAMALFVIGYGVLPIRSWLDQREQIDARRAELAELEAGNRELTERVESLGTLAEVERIARRDHGLVMPGEEAYAVLPPAPEPIRLPEAWPFTELAAALDG